jgi:hypothetical protein
MNSTIFGKTDIWESTSDDGGDSDYELNEIPPPDIDEKFRDDVLNVKHKLYEKLINEPEDSDENLKNYTSKLGALYVMAINAQSTSELPRPESLEQFPPELREQITNVLAWISDYFKKNTLPDTIPYTDYIKKSLHDYQFIQHNSFE